MHQPTLFTPTVYGTLPAPPAQSASGDPSTSHETEARYVRSSKCRRRRDLAVSLVSRWPGRTGHELWACATEAERLELGNHHTELYRRLAEAKNCKLLLQGDARICTVRRVRMVTWLPAVAPVAA
jgi:hypothetical protein